MRGSKTDLDNAEARGAWLSCWIPGRNSIFLAWAIWGLSVTAFAAEGLRVEAVRAGSGVAVAAQATITAPLGLIWETITDYAHLSEFVPGLKASRVIARRGSSVFVEQDGEAGLLFIKIPIRVVVESAEFPPDRVTIRVLRGNLKQLEGRYVIEPDSVAGQHVLRWSGIIEPDTVLPGFITVPLIRISIEDQFSGMVGEIERRQTLRAKEQLHARGN